MTDADTDGRPQPLLTRLHEGTALNLRGTVSRDRRFVTLELAPLLMSILQ